MRSVARVLVAACLAPMVLTSPAKAQQAGRIEVTPVVGLYLPVGTLIEVVDPGSGLGVKFEQQTAFTVGGRVAYWLSPQVALEGAVGYVPGDIKLTIVGTGQTPDPSQTEGGRVLAFSGRVRYRVAAGRPAFHVLGGVSVVSRYGNLWDLLQQNGITITGRTDVGAVLGVSLSLPVSPGFDFRADIEDHVHQAKFTLDDGMNPPENTDSRWQNDLVLSVGLAIQLGGRR